MQDGHSGQEREGGSPEEHGDLKYSTRVRPTSCALRPSVPKSVRPEVRQLILQCLHEDPVQRPTMAEVVPVLAAIVDQLQQQSQKRGPNLGRQISGGRSTGLGGSAVGGGSRDAAATVAGGGSESQGCACVLS